MEDRSQPLMVRFQLHLQEQLANIPRDLRPRFIRMLCQKLGLIDDHVVEQLTERMESYFAALDATRN